MLKNMTGIKPTGEMHIGNYVNTIKPIIEQGQENTIVLIADGHALTTEKINKSDKEKLIKTFFSFGIKNIVCQSKLPEIMELMWILTCHTEKGFMNRAHGYKAAIEKNINRKNDIDAGISMGLYSYPILMTSDLCIFGVDNVFIGADQLQHVEIAKNIVKKFNNRYNTDILKVPEPFITEDFMLPGYDNRKMSKSYGNTIPLMCSEKELKKHIFSVKTNSKNVGEPKEWDESPITKIYQCFAMEKECIELKLKMKNGIGWGEVKNEVFTKINNELEPIRKKFIKYNSTYINFMMYRTLSYIKTQVTDKMDKIKELVY